MIAILFFKCRKCAREIRVQQIIHDNTMNTKGTCPQCGKVHTVKNNIEISVEDND